MDAACLGGRDGRWTRHGADNGGDDHVRHPLRARDRHPSGSSVTSSVQPSETENERWGGGKEDGLFLCFPFFPRLAPSPFLVRKTTDVYLSGCQFHFSPGKEGGQHLY